MQTIRKLCPFCAAKISPTSIVCNCCGRDLQSLRLARLQAQTKADPYEIVRDGTSFGIAFRGEVRLHGLGLEEAQKTAAILNSDPQ